MKLPLIHIPLTLSLLIVGCVADTPSSLLSSSPTNPISLPAGTLEPPSSMTSQPSSTLATSTPQTHSINFEVLDIPGDYNPTQSHWSLWDLQRWHNRLYIAHGDWFNNTGPVRVLYLDLETIELVHDEGFIVDEEAIEIFRLYDDTLYIPGADPTEGWDMGNIYFKRWDESWTKQRSIPSSIHLWDVALLDDTWVAAGRTEVSGQPSGAIWTSSDQGQSWDWGPDFTELGYAEATSLFKLGNLLYATTVGTGCLAYDGSQWTEADCLVSDIFVGTAHVHKNTLFDSTIALAPYVCVTDTHLYLFDGHAHWMVELGEPVRDVVSSNEGLFVLSGYPTGKGSIYHAAELACHCEQDFSRIVDLDFGTDESEPEDATKPRCSQGSTPLSLEIHQNRFYVGLADGRLFQSQPYHPQIENVH